MQEIHIACIDGLKGFPEAIATVFPRTTVQLCVVHMVRNSLDFVSWKDRREVAFDLHPVYTAPTVEAAALALADFETKWDSQYPTIGQSWRRNWAQLTPGYCPLQSGVLLLCSADTVGRRPAMGEIWVIYRDNSQFCRP